LAETGSFKSAGFASLLQGFSNYGCEQEQLVDENYEYLSEDGSENYEWDDIDEMLAESRRRQKNRLQQRLDEVQAQIQERHEVYEKYIEIPEERIRVHQDRKDDAGHVNRPFEEEVLAKLEDLYESLRGEVREKWRDIQELEREKREIEKELDELKDAELLDSL
jgi:DNA repair exonuclease SbcCD ATPase subunit